MPQLLESEQGKTPAKRVQVSSLEVDPKVKERLIALQLGKKRLPRQTKEEFGTQRDLSAAGEPKGTPTTAYFRPTAIRLIAEASRDNQFPPDNLPEVCFAGRSNVGKSSLLNAIAGTPLSKTSPRPGETTNIRWYSNSDLITLVDLPGYGFSYAKSGRAEGWMSAVKTYLSERKSLKRCFVLIDARHPMKNSDESTLHFLEECRSVYQIVLTKTDLLSVDDLAKKVQFVQHELRVKFPRAIPEVLVVSSKDRSGLALLRRELISLFVPEAKAAYEALRDKKFHAANVRREKRRLQAEKEKALELKQQKRHSLRAFKKHLATDRANQKPL